MRSNHVLVKSHPRSEPQPTTGHGTDVTLRTQIGLKLRPGVTRHHVSPQPQRRRKSLSAARFRADSLIGLGQGQSMGAGRVTSEQQMASEAQFTAGVRTAEADRSQGFLETQPVIAFHVTSQMKKGFESKPATGSTARQAQIIGV